ncbi:PREDICTED: myosin light chain kinase 2, skeletal/cardiac muscle-like [Branchiostoma belcheri]|uniref:Myosin light chain kinase 2, skeletal/cardiac muscle-like n=1 Tax=Branchiostoma belcheri TaxID=7741 RepID=A0A6P5AA10_BRABE|nr:PREDICTED: myosin light chain kinase 2, skeletal/cardiac muscle-like [Branchiostoma belcheri]
MDVVWGIVSTLVYIVAVFIAVEFCCGRIKKYSSAKREEEEEGSGRRESATAATTDDVPGATASAETSAEAEAVVEKPSSDEERIRTAADDASEVPPEPEVTIDIHKEPPMPEKAIPDIIPEPENIPEPESIPEPENIPVDVHVKNEEETLETVPKEPKIQQVVEPEVEEVEPKVEEIEPEIVDVEPEVVEVKPAVVEAEPEIAEVEPEVEEVEPEGEDEGDAAVAATKIQAGFRGHQSRKRVKKLKEEKDAATKIQAGFRGWKSRKQVSVKRRGAPGVEVEADDHLTEEPPAAVTEEDTSLSMPSDVTEQHVAKETASAIELPPAMFAADMSPVEETAPEVPSPVVESTPTELFAKQPDVTPPASPEVTQPEIAETPSPTEAESPETSSPEEISPAPFSKPIPPTPPPTPADVDLFAGGTEATEPTSGTDPVLEGGEIVLGDVEPAMVKAVAEKLDVLEKETVEASEKVLYQPGTEVSFVVAPPPLQPVSMETVAMEETDSSPDSAEQSPVTVVEAKTLIKQESEVYPYVEETQTSEEFDPESLIAQAVSSKFSSSAAAAPEVVVTSERTVTMETGPDGKTTQTVVKVEHTVVKEITTVVTPKTTEVVTTEERTATSVSSDDRSSEEQVTVVEASDDDTFEESGLEQQQGEMGMMMRSSGPKDKGAQLDRTGASFTDKWEPEPGDLPPPAPFGERDISVRKDAKIADHYHLREVLATGRFGVVKRCVEKRLGLVLAAKTIKIHSPQDRIDVRMEIDVMKGLNHRNLLRIYDAFETRKEMTLVIEYIAGHELLERVLDDNYHLTEKDGVMFMRQVCEGVRYMHANGIIHLDLKPENIMCVDTKTNHVKIIDFGLARRHNPKKLLQVAFGTPEFCAPEILNYTNVSYMTDMWSVGVITFVVLSGLSPFLGEDDTETMNNVVEFCWDYEFEDEEWNDISTEAKDFISKLLVYNLG